MVYVISSYTYVLDPYMKPLVQRYDPDPAAKAAAATVLASKLGADSGLKVFVGEESKSNAPTGRAMMWKLRGLVHYETGRLPSQKLVQDQLVVEHYPQGGLGTQDGGWIARLAALLVGEDPTQSYALICGNCHMHNGLARKEDFPYVTYYCPHCHALNRPKQSGERVSGSNSPTITSSTMEDGDAAPSAGGSVGTASNSPVAAAAAATATATAEGFLKVEVYHLVVSIDKISCRLGNDFTNSERVLLFYATKKKCCKHNFDAIS
ncbi:UNVERIFIED_CONTAM: hypothetical protein Scaly_0575900 [Sesamum calycinum]|uniref:Lunapark zinc ribbon domain-containing protein n=1 Tax=Sesamum calycinum TaxID=2727403 RepID=A0AAW2RTY5_9LAMI